MKKTSEDSTKLGKFEEFKSREKLHEIAKFGRRCALPFPIQGFVWDADETSEFSR